MSDWKQKPVRKTLLCVELHIMPGRSQLMSQLRIHLQLAYPYECTEPRVPKLLAIVVATWLLSLTDLE